MHRLLSEIQSGISQLLTIKEDISVLFAVRDDIAKLLSAKQVADDFSDKIVFNFFKYLNAKNGN